MPTTVKELKDEIRQQVWPSGEAENLVNAHDQIFQEAFAEVAKWVDCERSTNADVTPFSLTFFNCGLTSICLPRGIVYGLFTIEADYCKAVFYNQVKWPKPLEDARRFLDTPPTPDQTGKPAYPLGFVQADASTDSNVGRARAGEWAIYDNKILIWPWIQSTESVVVLWKGLKTSWADTDIINPDQDYKKCIKLYLQYGHERDYGDMQAAMAIHNPAKNGTFDEALGDLSWECRERTRLRHENQAQEGKSAFLGDLSLFLTQNFGGSGGSGGGPIEPTVQQVLSGHGAPTITPEVTTIPYVYIDLDSGVLYNWNNETLAWS